MADKLKLFSYAGADVTKVQAKKSAGNLVFGEIWATGVTGGTEADYYYVSPNNLEFLVPTKAKYDALKLKVDALGTPLKFRSVLTMEEGYVLGTKADVITKMKEWYGAQSPAITTALKGDFFLNDKGEEWVVVNEVAVASLADADIERFGVVDPTGVVTTFGGQAGAITLKANADKIQLAMGSTADGTEKELHASVVPGSLERTDMAYGVTSALGYADYALQGLTGATGSSFVDVIVADKTGTSGAWFQEVKVALTFRGVSGATTGDDGIATAADVAKYFDDEMEVVIDALAQLKTSIEGMTGSMSADYMIGFDQVNGKVTGVSGIAVSATVYGATGATATAKYLGGTDEGLLLAGVTYVDEKIAEVGVEWEVIE